MTEGGTDEQAVKERQRREGARGGWEVRGFEGEVPPAARRGRRRSRVVVNGVSAAVSRLCSRRSTRGLCAVERRALQDASAATRMARMICSGYTRSQLGTSFQRARRQPGARPSATRPRKVDAPHPAPGPWGPPRSSAHPRKPSRHTADSPCWYSGRAMRCRSRPCFAPVHLLRQDPPPAGPTRATDQARALPSQVPTH